MGDRFIIGRFNDVEKIVGAEQRVLRDELAAERLDLGIDGGQPIRFLCRVSRPSGVKVVRST
jgi:hypothetical protein